jgi:hypothetical protein
MRQVYRLKGNKYTEKEAHHAKERLKMPVNPLFLSVSVITINSEN